MGRFDQAGSTRVCLLMHRVNSQVIIYVFISIESNWETYRELDIGPDRATPSLPGVCMYWHRGGNAQEHAYIGP